MAWIVEELMRAFRILQAPRQGAKGTPRRGTQKRPYRANYTQEELAEAIRLHSESKATVDELVDRFGIPRATLYRRLSAGATARVGHETVLTAEEEARLVHHLKVMSRIGLGLAKHNIVDVVRELVVGRPNPFGSHGPGRKWLVGFLNRHRDLSLRSTQGLQRIRASGDNVHTLEHYADLLEKLLTDIQFAPCNIYNLDETMFATRPCKTICEKGTRNNLALAPTPTLHTSVLACVNADGSKPMPPLIIYSGKNVMSTWTSVEGEFPGTLYTATENGWVTRPVFEDWFTGSFLPHVAAHRGVDAAGLPRPVLLIFDGHDSHISMKVTAAAESAGITLLQLPAHTSHRLQPLDVACFATWHKELNRRVHTRVITLPHQNMTREEISKLIAEPYRAALAKAPSGFRGAGIVPFDRARIVGSKRDALSPSVAVSRIAPTPEIEEQLRYTPTASTTPSRPPTTHAATTPTSRRVSPRGQARTPTSPDARIAALEGKMAAEIGARDAEIEALKARLAASEQRVANLVLRPPVSTQAPKQQDAPKKIPLGDVRRVGQVPDRHDARADASASGHREEEGRRQGRKVKEHQARTS